MIYWKHLFDFEGWREERHNVEMEWCLFKKVVLLQFVFDCDYDSKFTFLFLMVWKWMSQTLSTVSSLKEKIYHVPLTARFCKDGVRSIPDISR